MSSLKLFLIAIFLLMFAGIAMAQWNPSDSSQIGKKSTWENNATVGGHSPYTLRSEGVYKVGGNNDTTIAGSSMGKILNMNPLTGNSTSANQTTIIGYLNSMAPSSLLYTSGGIAPTSGTNITWSGASRHLDANFALGAGIGDTLFISSSNVFAPQQTIKIIGGNNYSDYVSFTGGLYFYCNNANKSYQIVVR